MTPLQIRRARLKLDKSQDAFAEMLGLEGYNRSRTVRRWELGHNKPGPETIKIIKQLLQEASP